MVRRRERVATDARGDRGRRGAIRRRQSRALRHRRFQLPAGADRRRRAAHRRRCRRHDRRVPRLRYSRALARRRHQSLRPVLQRRGRHRLLEVPQEDSRARPGSAARARRAWGRARRSARRRRAPSPDLRARSVHAQSQHPRRHDRQQLVRRALGHGGKDRRQRRDAGRGDLRRPAHDGRCDERRGASPNRRARRPTRRDLRGAARRFATAMPISSARAIRTFRGGSPATTSTSSCRRTASTSRARSWAPKARA